jgi:hypothetical protein
MSIPKGALRKRKLILALGVACTAAFLFVGVPSASALFTQCPPVGLDAGCGTLITVNPDGTGSVASDPTQGPYEGDEDTLVGLQNNSAGNVASIVLSSAASPPIFGFDDDGLCTETPGPSGCPFGPTGYEGPGVSFTNVSGDSASGTVVFNPPIPPSGAACSSGGASGSGGSAYFSLENDVSAADINLGTISSQTVPGPTVTAINYSPKKSLKPTVPGVRAYINVSEPSTVVVTATLLVNGKSVKLGTFTLVDNGRKKLRLALPKSLRTQLKIGDRVTLKMKLKATPLSPQACQSSTTKNVSLKTQVVHVLKSETNN